MKYFIAIMTAILMTFAVAVPAQAATTNFYISAGPANIYDGNKHLGFINPFSQVSRTTTTTRVTTTFDTAVNVGTSTSTRAMHWQNSIYCLVGPRPGLVFRGKQWGPLGRNSGPRRYTDAYQSHTVSVGGTGSGCTLYHLRTVIWTEDVWGVKRSFVLDGYKRP